MCRNTEMCRIPPPPPFGTCATIDFGGAPKKKSVGVPPPPLSSFFGTCATFEAGGGPEKKPSVVPPPPFEILDPPLMKDSGLYFFELSYKSSLIDNSESLSPHAVHGIERILSVHMID